MLDHINTGAEVAMTPKEADALCGDQVRLVTCANGRVIGGMGQVGLVEHASESDLQAFIDEVKAKRAALKALADQQAPGENKATFAFTRI